MDETKIIYYVDDEETPYLIKFHTSPDQITLGDFKSALNKSNYKFFFKSLDDDFGVVKEEITDDDCKLPCVNGKVVSWLVVADGSTQSDNHSSSGKEVQGSGDNDNSRDKDIISDSSDPKSPIIRNFNRQMNNKSQMKAEENKKHKSKHKFTGPEKITLDETDDAFDEIDSIYNADKVPPLRKFNEYKHNAKMKKIRAAGGGGGGMGNNANINNNGIGVYNTKSQPIYESSSSMLSSDIDTTSFFDSEDESSRFSSATETTMSSKYGRQRRQLRRRRKMPHLSRASSFSSMTDSTVSLNIITVTLNMDSVPFLGISIVGQTNGCQENGDGGIYVGSIMKGGAVALDGRIEPGDMILEVNGISFENVSNEEAVRALREQVQRPGPVTLVVAKSWDPPASAAMAAQQQQQQQQQQHLLESASAAQVNNTVGGPTGTGGPVRPIDPRAWILHTMAATAGSDGSNPGNVMHPAYMPPPPQGVMSSQPPTHMMLGGGGGGGGAAAMSTVASTLTTTSSSLKSSSVVEGGGGGGGNQGGPHLIHHHGDGTSGDNNCLVDTGLTTSMDPMYIVRAMAQPDSGLLIRDRLWLKITIYNAFIGSDLVDWLYSHVQGFSDRKDARKYGSNLLKSGLIRHTVNKSTFSEQCYYVLNEMTTAFSTLNLDSEIDSVSVVAGQQQAKARMLQQQHELAAATGGVAGVNSKDSPVLSSGFQSACSNKWSAAPYNPPPVITDPSLSGNMVPAQYNMYQNNHKQQNYYHESPLQSQNQSVQLKPISNLTQGLSTNLKPSRNTGSVHSGSGSSAASVSSSSNVARAITLGGSGVSSGSGGGPAVGMNSGGGVTGATAAVGVGSGSYMLPPGCGGGGSGVVGSSNAGGIESGIGMGNTISSSSAGGHYVAQQVVVAASLAATTNNTGSGTVSSSDLTHQHLHNHHQTMQQIPAHHNENSSSGFFSEGIDKCD